MNKIVKVAIDRPLGSYHPKHKDIYYFVNKSGDRKTSLFSRTIF